MNVETALIYLTGGEMVERAPLFFAKRQGKKNWHEFSRLPMCLNLLSDMSLVPLDHAHAMMHLFNFFNQ